MTNFPCYSVNTDCIENSGKKFYAAVVRDATTGCIVKQSGYYHPTQAIAYRAAKNLRRAILADDDFNSISI